MSRGYKAEVEGKHLFLVLCHCHGLVGQGRALRHWQLANSPTVSYLVFKQNWRLLGTQYAHQKGLRWALSQPISTGRAAEPESTVFALVPCCGRRRTPVGCIMHHPLQISLGAATGGIAPAQHRHRARGMGGVVRYLPRLALYEPIASKTK